MARVVRVDAHEITLSTLEGVRRVPVPDVSLAVGDLVELDGEHIQRRIAVNQSDRPVDQQDWWRLHRILPNLRTRAAILCALRQWFNDQDFLEVETPIITAHPGMEVHLAPVDVQVRGQKRHLITSPEYHMKRLLSTGLPRLYYLGKSFRDDERGHHHSSEFTMLEWYRSGETPEKLMEDVETIVAMATGTTRSWHRITVREALEQWGHPSDDPDSIVRQLVERVEPELATLGAVFLTDYPACLASLARINPNDPTTSARFEAYVDGVELANGFGELTDPAEQRARLEEDSAKRRAADLKTYDIDESFLDALAAGLPPCSGIALGIDRLIMLATNANTIDDVLVFPPETA